MRTKALLLSAAIGAISLATSFAQVYSVNVVGYVNVPVIQGFNCVANPLDATPNNNINSVLPTVPDGSGILKWDVAGQGFATPQTYYDGYGWADPDLVLSTMTVGPGEGFFFNSPSATNLTFVGEVRQGSLSNNLVLGFNLVAQLTPQSGDIMAFEFPARDGDGILYWNAAGQGYATPITYYDGYGWADPDLVLVVPNVNVGQGFFVNKAIAAPWTHTFNVNTP